MESTGTQTHIGTTGKKPVDFVNYLGLGLLFGLAIFLSFIKISDDDVFWQLATGRWIINHHAIPSQDIFGFVTGGQQWFPTEWLWCVLLYISYTAANSYIALEILTAIVFAGIVAFQVAAMRRSHVTTPLILFITLLVLLTTLGRILPRPHIVTALGLAITVFILYRHHFSPDAKGHSLIILPVIFLLWANMHPAVLAGLILIVLAVVAEFLRIILLRTTPGVSADQSADHVRKKFKKLSVVFLFCLTAIMLNPHGIDTYFYIYQHAQMKFLGAIHEWDSPFSISTVMVQVWFYKILLVLGIATIFYSFRKKDPLPAILYFAFALYSFQAVRLRVDFAIVTAPGTALSLQELVTLLRWDKLITFITGKVPTIALTLLIAAILCFVPGGTFYTKMGVDDRYGTGIDSTALPIRMINFVQQERIQGRPFNEFGIGGFLLWEFPEMKDFIDSRDINDTIGYLYASMYNLQPGFERNFRMLGIDNVLTYIPGQERDAGLMSASPIPYFSTHREEWKLVFWDDRSSLYVKNIPKFRSTIERYEYKILHPYLFAYQPRLFDSLRAAFPQEFQEELKRKLQEEPGGKIIRFIMR
jgi:hypothetical protein